MEKHLATQRHLEAAIAAMPATASLDEDIAQDLRRCRDKLERRLGDLRALQPPAPAAVEPPKTKPKKAAN